jgi:hypothetical protein
MSLYSNNANRFSYTSIESSEFTTDDFPCSFNEYYDGSLFGVDFQDVSIWRGEKPGFFTQLSEKFNTQSPSGLLFPAILYNAPGILVFERPPTHKFIEYFDVPVDNINEDESYGVHTFNLPLPWQLYVAEYDPKSMLVYKVHMYFMNECFKGVDQIMYSPPIPNFYANGTLCRPFISNMEDIERYEKNLSGVMASSYDWIWNSGFNHDLSETINSTYQDNKNSFYDPNYCRHPATKSWHRYCHPTDIVNLLKKWETFDINNILSIKWSNLSVTPLWDSELEWFYENDPEYPSDEDSYEYDSFEEYSESISTHIRDIKKSFSIMMHSVCSENSVVYNSQKDISYANRFNLYRRCLSI